MIKEKSLHQRVITIIVLVLTIIICAGFIISAYCGMISPSTLKYAPIAAMTFPLWLIAVLIIGAIDTIWWRRTAAIPFLSILICIPHIYKYSPFNLPNGEMNEAQKSRSFTIMTYNVLQFINQNPNYPYDDNAQLEYIMTVSPDIVVLEEAEYLGSTPSNKITQDQLTALHRMYPYTFVESNEFAFLSKYPAEPIPVSFPKKDFSSGDIAGWRFYKNDIPINVIGVHLASFSLGRDEKEHFKEMTTPDKVEASYLRDMRYDYLPKVVRACQQHEGQIKILERILKKYGGENTIVCGDFNDPIGSYPLYYLEEYCNLKQVYPEVGFGPMITYNANHFLFRIDHILYRGNLKPYSMTRGNLKASDHYPLIATFLIQPGK